MYRTLRDFMNDNDSVLVSVAAHNFRTIGLDQIARRLEWYYAADHTMVRPLRDIYLLHFRLAPRTFLRFCEQRPSQLPMVPAGAVQPNTYEASSRQEVRKSVRRDRRRR